jgi:hypothetical protein
MENVGTLGAQDRRANIPGKGVLATIVSNLLTRADAA